MKKQLFLKVINNKLLFKSIFKYIHWIHNDIEQYREFNSSYYLNDKEIVKYNELLQRPDIAAIYNYVDIIKEYYEEPKQLFKVVSNLAKFGHLESLKIILENKNNNNSNNEYLIKPLHFLEHFSITQDLMSCISSTKAESKPIIEYLESIKNQYQYNWKYRQAFQSSLLSANIERCKYFANKIGIYHDQSSQIQYSDTNGLYFFDILQLYCNAARGGSVEVFKWLERLLEKESIFTLKTVTVVESNIRFIFTEAVKSLSIEMLDYLYSIDIFQKTFMKKDLLETIFTLRYQRYSVLDWLISKGCHYKSSYLILCALKHGMGAEIIKWLHRHIPPISNNELHQINYYHSDIIQWLEINSSQSRINLVNNAISNLNLDFLKWIHENSKMTGSDHSLDVIAHNPNASRLLDWFIENNRPECFSSRVLSIILIQPFSSCSSNYIKIVNWIIDSSRSNLFTVNVLDHILLADYPKVVDLAIFVVKNHRIGCTTDAMDNVVFKNSIQYLDWFQDNIPNPGCSSRAFDSAIEKQNINILNWLQKYCPTVGCSKYGSFQALKNGNLEIVKWVLENYRSRFWSKRFKLKLFKNEKTFTKKTKKFIIYNFPNQLPYDILNYYQNDIEIVKYIVDNHRQYIRDESIIFASEKGYLEIVKLMHSYHFRNIISTKKHFIYSQALSKATTNNHTDIISFLSDKQFKK